MQRTRPTPSFSNRTWLWALLALIALGALELSGAAPFRVPGPFALAWQVQTHPVASWMSATLFSLLLLSSGRLFFSLVMVALSCGVVVLSSRTKINYLGTPLTLADVNFFTRNVSENIVLFKSYPTLGVLIIGAAVIIAGGGFLVWKRERTRGAAARIASATALLSLAGCALLSDNAYNPAIPRPAPLHDNISTGNGFTQLQKFKATGEGSSADLLEIFATDASTEPTLPERIPSNRFKPTQIAGDTGSRPDIFAILEESTFDPRLLAACDNRPECSSPLFKPSGQNEQSGVLFVHNGAGGTWLSEFAFLTGFDWRSFGPAGAHAPTTLAQRVASPLPKHLQKLGYQTIAFYPVAGNFLNARSAYQSYGFEHFIATDDLDIKTDWKHTADSELFDKALDRIEKIRDGRPVFIFLLTIRNHGPHAEQIADLDQPAPAAMRDLPPPLIDYLLRLKESASALQALRQRWLNTPRPRVLAWFGDHQPLFAVQSKTSAQYIQSLFPQQRPSSEHLHNLTWYSLSSNSPPPPEAAQSNSPLDLAYLHAELLVFSGLPPQASTAATREIQTLCPMGIILCTDGRAVKEYLSFRIWDLKDISSSHP